MELDGRIFGIEMKAQHSIIEKWPFAMKLRYGEPGAQEEFETLFESGQTGAERFVEWKRVTPEV